MVESLRDVSRQGVTCYPTTPREQWVLEWPGQIVLVVTAIFWTQEVGGAIAKPEKGPLQACADHNTAQLTNIVELVSRAGVR